MSGSETDKVKRYAPIADDGDDYVMQHWRAGAKEAELYEGYHEYVLASDFDALQSRLSAAQGEITKWRDLANLWADVACNGLQYLKNTADGISTASTAISDLGREIQSVRALSPPSQQEIQR